LVFALLVLEVRRPAPASPDKEKGHGYEEDDTGARDCRAAELRVEL
jgi:hypothetical protein